MRRLRDRAAAGLAVAVIVAFLAGCGDSTVQPRVRPPASGLRSAAPAPTLDQQIVGIFALLPSGLSTAGQAKWTDIKRQMALTPSGVLPGGARGPAKASRQMLVQLVAWVQDKTGDFTPPLGESQAHLVARLSLYMSLYVYGGRNAPAPAVGSSSDVALSIVSPTSADTVATPTQHAAVAFPAGSVSEPTVLVIVQDTTKYQNNCSGPLVTGKCQYPQFYRFNAFPDVKLNQPATVGVCHVNSGENRLPLADHDRFRLAHDKPADPSAYVSGATEVDSIEILPLVSATAIMNCTSGNTYSAAFIRRTPGAIGGMIDRAGWLMGRLAHAVASAVTPKNAYAIDQGGGGDVLIFSSFAVVDPAGQPDLKVGTFTPQQTEAYPGETVHISALAPANVGTATATTFNTRVFLSTDSTINGYDTYLGGNDSTVSLAPAQPATPVSLDVVIPADTKPGTYYLGALADADTMVAESNETNNYVSVRFTVMDPHPVYTVAALPTIAGDTGIAFAINDAGVIVGRNRMANSMTGTYSAVYWAGGVVHVLPDAGGGFNEALAINKNGEMVGQVRFPTPGGTAVHAAYWSPSGAFTDLGTIKGWQGVAQGINDLGDVVGAAGLSDSSHALRWPAHDALIDDGTFGYINASYSAINNRGEVVLNTDVGLHYTRVWVFKPGQPRAEVPNLGSVCSICGAIGLALSDSGLVTGLSGLPVSGGSEQTRAYLTRVGGPATDLGTLGGDFSQARAINVHGVIVGQAKAADGNGHAFVWTRTGGMQALPELPGAAFSNARGINSQGAIVGQVVFADGRSTPVIWTITAVLPPS